MSKRTLIILGVIAAVVGLLWFLNRRGTINLGQIVGGGNTIGQLPGATPATVSSPVPAGTSFRTGGTRNWIEVTGQAPPLGGSGTVVNAPKPAGSSSFLSSATTQIADANAAATKKLCEAKGGSGAICDAAGTIVKYGTKYGVGQFTYAADKAWSTVKSWF